MILGYHFIFSAYGFWLPNDPRGSWSDVVREYEIAFFGPATKINTTRSVAATKHDHTKRLAAKKALRYPPVLFTGEQAKVVAQGFATACCEANYRAIAFAIMPDHAHLLLEQHPKQVDQIASHLKAKATRALTDAQLHPMSQYPMASGRFPSPWARNHWRVFVTQESQMHVAMKYVNDNPAKAGLRPQRWSFVRPYRA